MKEGVHGGWIFAGLLEDDLESLLLGEQCFLVEAVLGHCLLVLQLHNSLLSSIFHLL